MKRDFDRSTQGVLFDFTRGPVATDPSVARARALMEEVPRYLQAMRRKGKPVLGGVVENVVQVRKWDEFGRWRREIEAEGYRTRLVALNSMHVHRPAHGARVAQSRNRFYMPFWLAEIGMLTTRDRYALIGAGTPVDECTFRMLATHEIAGAWASPRTTRSKGPNATKSAATATPSPTHRRSPHVRPRRSDQRRGR
ncbi:MAG: (cytosine-5)-methyltransferase 1 [Actinomycetota bacterium]|nr:(cytosine-5)-methyltransferase 1 [Actinomycetota bacterium]